MAVKVQLIFEKVAAMIFLFILVGLIAFLVYIPMPGASEKVILIIIGGLMTTAATALPKLFGTDDSRETELKNKIAQLDSDLKAIKAEYETLKLQYDKIVIMLVDKYVVPNKK